jgi:hypothetical protein
MLPHLRHKDDGVGVGPVETQRRKPDEGEDYGTLDAIFDDLSAALEKRDRARGKAALQSLCEHIQAMDAEQDEAQG